MQRLYEVRFNRRSAAVLNSGQKLFIHYNTFKKLAKPVFSFMFCVWEQLFYLTESDSTFETKSCYSRATVN